MNENPKVCAVLWALVRDGYADLYWDEDESAFHVRISEEARARLEHDKNERAERRQPPRA